jgi:hypothetical protein
LESDSVFPTTACCKSAAARAASSTPPTQWVRNAEASGEVTLKKGSAQKYRLRALPDAEKPEILKAYLDRFKNEVQTYFPVAAGSPVEAFVALAGSYPVFELLAA